LEGGEGGGIRRLEGEGFPGPGGLGEGGFQLGGHFGKEKPCPAVVAKAPVGTVGDQIGFIHAAVLKDLVGGKKEVGIGQIGVVGEGYPLHQGIPPGGIGVVPGAVYLYQVPGMGLPGVGDARKINGIQTRL